MTRSQDLRTAVDAGGSGLRLQRAPGILTLGDANTTIGYCRYNPDAEVEYIFVHPAWRRRGVASFLLELVEQEVQRRLHFQPPISPLGRALVQAYESAYASSHESGRSAITPT